MRYYVLITVLYVSILERNSVGFFLKPSISNLTFPKQLFFNKRINVDLCKQHLLLIFKGYQGVVFDL